MSVSGGILLRCGLLDSYSSLHTSDRSRARSFLTKKAVCPIVCEIGSRSGQYHNFLTKKAVCPIVGDVELFYTGKTRAS